MHEAIMLPVIMISLALALRQMSMTIVSPFISTYCKSLAGYTPFLAGLAVGDFGLMQALFQIPFGMLSDRFGNKRIMIMGLSIVIVGFILGFLTKDIWVLILARVLQGSGAVLAVGYSWVAGLSKDGESRTKAMSTLGGFVSAAGALAFAIGPLLRGFLSVNGMYLAGAILLTANVLYIIFFLKDANEKKKTAAPKWNELTSLLKSRPFVIMNLAAFLNNFMLMSIFYAAPIEMDSITGQGGMWKIFVPAILIAILFMKIAVHWVSKGKSYVVLLVSFVLSVIGVLFYFQNPTFLTLLAGTIFYLCSYVTIATVAATYANEGMKDELRGTGNGIFNSFQYIGAFIGAVITGAIWGVSRTATWGIILAAGTIGCILFICTCISSNKQKGLVK